MALNLVGESFWGFQMAMISTATVFTLMLRQLGASKPMIGGISAVESGMILLPQFLSFYVFRSRQDRKRHLILWHYACMLPFIFAIGLIVRTGGRNAPLTLWGCFACFALFNAGMGIVTPAWTDWLAHVFSVGVRGTAMGLAFLASALLGTLGAVVAGRLIGSSPGIGVFSTLYLVAGALACLSIGTFWFIEDPGAGVPDDPGPASDSHVLDHVRQSLQEPNFRAFLVGRMLMAAGFSIVPFITIYYTTLAGGGLSNGRIVSCGAATTIGSAVVTPILGVLGDRIGHRLGLLVGAFAQVVALLIVLLSSGVLSCLAAYTCVGICLGSGFVSHFNMLFETCPHENRIAHIMTANVLMGLVVGPSALADGAIASAFGVGIVFRICLGVSIVALGWLTLRLEEPRRGAPCGHPEAPEDDA